MAKLLYSFPNTPEAADERDSVCAMLDEHQIDYYETPGSTWGFSKAAVWIRDDNQIEHAKQLFVEHSIRYAEQARRRYQEETGYDPNASLGASLVFNLKHLFRRKQLMLLLAFAGLLLYLYLDMFLGIFLTD